MNAVNMLTRIMLAVVAVGFVALLAGCQQPAAKLRGEGLELYTQDQYEPALDKFYQALKYDEFEPRANYYAGAINEKLGKFEQAEYHLKLAWQADPGRPEVKDALTITLLREDKDDAALDFLERDAALTAKVHDPRQQLAAEKHPPDKRVEVRMYLGRASDRLRVAQIYEKIGDMENARVNYGVAVKMAPQSVDAQMAAGIFYDKIGDHADAETALRKAYNIDPATPGLVEAMTKAGVAISGG